VRKNLKRKKHPQPRQLKEGRMLHPLRKKRKSQMRMRDMTRKAPGGFYSQRNPRNLLLSSSPLKLVASIRP
jgi:hypothetical protein